MSKPKITRELRKLKILDGSVQLTYIETEHVVQGEDVRTVADECFCNSKHRPHDDLLNAMKALRGFFIEICELGKAKEQAPNFYVSGISLSGMDEDETSQVIITAQKTIKRTGQVIIINSPLTTLSDTKRYADAEALDKVCAKIRDEAFMFKFEGKHAPEPQIELFKPEGKVKDLVPA